MRRAYIVIGAVGLAACALGGLWLFLRSEPPVSAFGDFQKTCVEGQRRLVAGDVQRLDDESEARILGYCDCVANEVADRLSQRDIAAFGLGQSDPAVETKLQVIIGLCVTRNP